MNKELLIPQLKEKSTPAVFRKGESYFETGKVKNRRIMGQKTMARVTGRRNYGVVLLQSPDGLSGYCSCPFFSENGNDFCKHMVAVGIARIASEESFIDMDAMREKIFRQDRELLAEVMATIIEIYPELIDDMGMDITDGEDFNTTQVIQAIFSGIDPLDITEMDHTLRRIKTVLARAEIETNRDNHHVARTILFELIMATLKLDEEFDSPEIFPRGFIGFIFSHYLKNQTLSDSSLCDIITDELAEMKKSPYFAREGLQNILETNQQFNQD